MKKLFEISVAIKSIAAMVLAGQIFLYLIIGSFFGLSSMEFSSIWQAIIVAVVVAVLQYITFTEALITKMSSTLRIIVFSITLYAILATFSIIFRWFPISIFTWSMFTLFFIVTISAFIFAFSIYTKVTGKKFNESLDAYKRKSAV